MGALQQIKQAGFTLALVDGGIEISPSSALTQSQREFLKSHKAEIISELQAEQIRQAEDEQRILNWLSLIGETNQAVIDDTLNRCRTDSEAREYFLHRANKI